MSELHPDTLAIELGRAGNGDALTGPLLPSTTMAAASVAEAAGRILTPRTTEVYSRFGNPGVQAFADAVAELEGAEAGVAFASGMGAMTTAVLALCSAGDHVVAQHQLFGATHVLFSRVCPRLGIETSLVDGTDPSALAGAVRPETRLIVIETPTNPTMDIVDLSALGRIEGPVVMVDSTFATPLVQRPLSWPGIDLVLHSATKGLAGHNDATIGVVCGSEALVDAIWAYGTVHGATASPYDAWNALRGLRTLPVRLERQQRTCALLAAELADHPAVGRVRYPGSADHPQAELATAQMTGGGTCLSLELVGGMAAAMAFVDGLELVRLAASLGGPETLVTHPVTMTHANMSEPDRVRAGIGEGMIRLSAGLEHPEDLLVDLRAGLDQAAGMG